MRQVYILITIIIVSLSFYYCDKDNSLNGIKVPEGAYAYTGFDSTGVKIVHGWIKVVFEDTINISGEWQLDKIGDPQNIGPQTGAGNLVGNVEHGDLYINLNPQWADNNVHLACPYDDKKLVGQWMYTGFPGVINAGNFVAEKE